MHNELKPEFPDTPAVVLLNNRDLHEAWIAPATVLADFAAQGVELYETSAKTGLGVAEVFLRIAEKMTEEPDP